MNTRYTTVNLDVSQQGSIPSITLSQYDLGVGLGFYIMDGGLPYSEFAETDTVVLSGTKPSGVGFTVPAYYKSGNLCSFRTTQAMTTEAGTVTCEITITKVNNISVSTANFFLEVEASAHAHETVDEDIEDFGLIANQVGEYKVVAVRAAQQAAQSATDAAVSASSAEESMEAAQSAASSAIAAKDDIQEYIDDSEAWARGTRGGSAVSSTDETYENNSKYYAEQSSASALAAGVSQSEAAVSAQEAAASVVGAVKYTAQSLTTEQKAQARTNIDAASPSDIPSGTVRYDASQNLTDAQKTQALANIGGAFAGSVAGEFNASTAYAVGDTVVYQGRLYEFTSAHAAGAWNASHVTAISVMDEVSDIKGDLSYYAEEAIAVYSTISSYRLDGTGKSIASTSYNMVKYKVTAGDTLHLVLSKDVVSSEAEGVYQWQNASNVPTSLPNSNLVGTPISDAVNGLVTVPVGATFLIVSQFKTNTTNSVKLVTENTTIKEKVSELETEIDSLEPGLSDNAKEVLLECFKHTAWIDEHGQDYYNALYYALYGTEPYWDYEWSSSSRILPTDLTASYYDFTTEAGILFVKNPRLDFEYTGDCKMQIEMKTYSENQEGEHVFAGLNNPQFQIQNAIVNTNQFRGIKMVLDSALGTSSEHGMVAVGINGTNSLIAGSNSNEYHVYEITAINNMYSLFIDGNQVELTQNTDTTAYIAFTGIGSSQPQTPAFYGAFIKSIKFKQL